jgi:antitoxin component of MazEF toxin-antitoxin module
MRTVIPLRIEEKRALRLPRVVLWALGLNAGDLLAVDRREGGDRAGFRSYGERVRRAVQGCSHPWIYVEELLRLPMTAVGADGAVILPDAVAARLGFELGDELLLQAWVERGDRGFTLERLEGRRIAADLWAEARYSLAVEADCRVTLPADALWALSLSAPQNASNPPKSLRLEALLIPSTRVLLVVTLLESGACFRLEPYLEL